MVEIIKTSTFELAVYIKGNKDAKELALVLPGRLDTKDYTHMRSHVDYLAKLGYLALAFDPPGTWESPGSISKYTTTNYIKAVNELIRYFGKTTALLFGHSRGGAVAALVGASNPSVSGIGLLMANYGAPTAPSQDAVMKGFDVSFKDLPVGLGGDIGKRRFELPLTYFEDGKKYDQLLVLKRCIKPKLLVFAKKDRFTPLDEARRISLEVPEPKLVRELDCGHDYHRDTKMIDRVNRIIEEFISKYCKRV